MCYVFQNDQNYGHFVVISVNGQVDWQVFLSGKATYCKRFWDSICFVRNKFLHWLASYCIFLLSFSQGRRNSTCTGTCQHVNVHRHWSGGTEITMSTTFERMPFRWGQKLATALDRGLGKDSVEAAVGLQSCSASKVIVTTWLTCKE